MLLERGELEQRVGGKVAGTEVAEGFHFFAEEEEALFRAHRTGAPLRTTDGAEENCVGELCGVEREGGERASVLVDRGTADELVVVVEGKLLVGGLDDVEDLDGLFADFGTAVVT